MPIKQKGILSSCCPIDLTEDHLINVHVYASVVRIPGTNNFCLKFGKRNGLTNMGIIVRIAMHSVCVLRMPIYKNDVTFFFGINLYNTDKTIALSSFLFFAC